jgi:cyclophilin family peptidyl-prolyl cis-trans isomerase/HEAT repeat protein
VVSAGSTDKLHAILLFRSMFKSWAFIIALLSASCATAPPVAAPAPSAPAPTVAPVAWEEKLGWIVRLEDQRLLREPNPPAPVILRPATRTDPPLVAPPQPSDLIRLLSDSEARVRRRAALAAGRVGLPAAVEPLTRLLTDEEFEVRQMAAFALGLLADASARPMLLKALDDSEPIVQGRAAEALGSIGDRTDADAISAMVRRHVAAGAIAKIEPDDLSYPLDPPVEAARLGLYALTKLRAYDALAAAVLDPQGQPVSRWWPVAYALQRVGDPRAAPTLLTLLSTPGRYTASFAARGLASTKATQASGPLREIVTERRRDPAVVIQAIRGLAAIADQASVPALTKMVTDRAITGPLRQEAMTALATLIDSRGIDLLLDLVSDPVPTVRGSAFSALARIEPSTFLSVLAGLDADADWTVRVAIATALGNLSDQQGVPRLTVMLQDRDNRVIPAVLNALVASKAQGMDKVLLERLKSDDFVIRAAAANGLVEVKAAGAAQALSDAYRASAGGDVTYVARAAALGALAKLDAAAARPLLQDALDDRDWAVRVRARQLLAEQGVTGVEDKMRPAVAGRPVDSPDWLAIVSPRFSPRVFLDTDKGSVELELTVLDAPLTVSNFSALARKGFFNNIPIHRVVPDFVVQDGDPRGDGESGPGYTIRDEINQHPYLRGTVGMALDWQDTGGSQFFITHSPQPHLDGRYTVFGHVVNGMDVVDRLVPGDALRGVRVRDGVTPD